MIQPGVTGKLAESKKSLGTFDGVFTPSILTILGVIMYLKLGWVVGNVGLSKTLLIVTLATSITFLTGLSIAAIATDHRVRAGGAYYMISRSLGLEAGGAVGIPLFLAQALSVSLYTVGFAESFTAVFPQFSQELIVSLTIILVAGIALLSPRLAIRTQYLVMGVVLISILSLLFGKPISTEVAGASGTVSDPVGFWTAFAVFFPAVTGITVGVNLSGDLKDPSRSIPLGTFLAIGTGYLVYMILPVILAFRAGPEALISDPLIMRPMSLWGNTILLGVWGGALSSAVGSILGAPRVLQALARDNVLPASLQWLGKGTGPDDSPRTGTVVTLIFSGTAAYFGNLEVIAPVLTMFFLTTYGALNVAAGLERFLRSPSFRPKIKIHWAFSLLGAVGCFWVMALINSGATLVASIFVGSVYVWLKKRELTAAWGDLRRGLWMAIIRTGLLALRKGSDARNWRPNILVFSGSPTRRWHLIDLANSFSRSQGLLTVSTVVPEESISPERSTALESKIRNYCERRGVQSLVRVIPAPDAYSGVRKLVEAYGVGPLIPNSVLLGQNYELSKDRKKFCSLVKDLYTAKRNVFILRAVEESGFRKRKRIDIWWGGLQGNGALMLILGYLTQTSLMWKGSEVHLRMVVKDEIAKQEALQNLKGIIEKTRTNFIPHVITSDKQKFAEQVLEHSRDADLVFLGIRKPDDNFLNYWDELLTNTNDLPATVFILAAEEIAFKDVLIHD